MSFGFQLFDKNGGLALDDKSFSIIGRESTLSGNGSFPVYPEFVALGVSGGALVGKGLRWHIGGGRVHYFVLNGGALNVIIFEDSNKTTANHTMGLEIFSGSGVKTFASGDRHFEVISQTTLWNHVSYHTEALSRGAIYILHSARRASALEWNTPRGSRVGVDALSADNQTVTVKPVEAASVPGSLPAYLSRQWRGTPSSQLLRVRYK